MIVWWEHLNHAHMYTHVEVFKQKNDKIGQNNTEARSYACVGSVGGGGTVNSEDYMQVIFCMLKCMF